LNESARVLNRVDCQLFYSPRAALGDFLMGEVSSQLDQPAEAIIHYRKYLDRRPGLLDYYVQEEMGTPTPRLVNM
jgi:hypothetical protein